MADDLYALLGVARGATPDEIKRAYRDMARRYHPDKAPNDENAAHIFAAAADAWRVLGDPELKQRYDAYGLAANRAAVEESPADIFEEIFGSKRGDRPRPQRASEPPRPKDRPREPEPKKNPSERGEDLRYRLEVDFGEAVFGTERTISVNRRHRCGSCHGSGAQPGSSPVNCPTCQGSGHQRTQQGFFASTKTCEQCGGAGRVIDDPCRTCRGTGETRQARTLSVRVPGGVDQGTRLKVANEGEPGRNGGGPGDLFVVIEVKKHPFLEREGQDVSAEIPIRFAQAALGATIEVPTLEGVVRMRVPPGSQSGRVFRLKGKGLPGPDGKTRGDQRVRILVDVPDQLGADERRLLEEYDAQDVARGGSPRAKEYADRLAVLESPDSD